MREKKKVWKNEDSELQREWSQTAHSAVWVSPESAKFIRRRHHLFSGDQTSEAGTYGGFGHG